MRTMRMMILALLAVFFVMGGGQPAAAGGWDDGYGPAYSYGPGYGSVYVEHYVYYPPPPPPQYVVAYPVYPPITRRVYGYDSGYGYAADNGYAGAYRSYSGGYYPRGYYPARQHFGYRAARHSVRRHW